MRTAAVVLVDKDDYRMNTALRIEQTLCHRIASDELLSPAPLHGRAPFGLVASGSTGSFAVLYAFGSANPEQPIALSGALIQGSDGNPYRTSLGGGTADKGTLFWAVF